MNPNLHIENLIISQGSQILIRDFSTEIHRGGLLILSGRNGSGKSTLLRTIAGLRKALSGHISINGTAPDKDRIKTAKLIAFANTERIQEDFITISDMVEFGAYPYLNEHLKDEKHNNTLRMLELMGIYSLRHKYLNQISDGEWQKANIARALNQSTPIVLLDEPSAFLDYPSKKELYLQLRQLSESENKLFIVSTHDIELANAHGQIFWHIENESLRSSDYPFNW